ncbi:hypothetical protein JD844_031968 [Phrynosoma platyrhinos]|uniref:UDP-glucose glycoprotein glucosyltransferase 2 n=1 Tax=Phrynosoma platyrhinos TaxID=52577 RepID=A0ABQ7T4U0_PHRPL|nr:hypothetical protein JD844_031968 [Phrynosoma platyrhinos]
MSSILETLKLEGKAMHGLHSLGIKGDVLRKLMRLPVRSNDDTYAIDIRHSSIIWINNIEKDQMYNKWPSSFQELLKPAYAGMMGQIRRNLYNLVLFIDPVQEEAADFMKLVEVIYSQKVPLRIGFVFILNTDEVVDGNVDAGVALWRAFNYVADEMDIPEAFATMINMYHKVKDRGVLSVDDVKHVLRGEFPHADIQDILGIHSEYDEKRKAGAVFYKKTGLGPLPQALFNGVPFNRKEMNVAELQTSLLKIVDVTESFQRAVFMGMDGDAFEKKYHTLGIDIIQAHRIFCQEVLRLLPGQMAVISNGRIIGPLEENELSAEDFDLLEKVTLSLGAVKIKALVKEMGVGSKRGSNLVMKVNALLSSLPKMDTRRDVEFLKEQHSVLKVDPQEEEPFFDVVGIVDPLTREAQKLSHLLLVLRQIVNMRLRLFMNCRLKLSEAPLKGFYRFVLEPELTAGTNNFFPLPPGANFFEMPDSPLLTLNMITPESWLVEAVNSSYDLDNIHLKDVDDVVSAEYELEYLLLEGHCFDVTTRQPPRGLQFTLGTRNNPIKVDTIVMANLGYFQLKANPGAWTLRLREGRSENIYQIFKLEGTESSEVPEEVIVVLNNFRSKIIKVQVQKKPDKIDEELLSDGPRGEEENSVASLTGGTQTAEKKVDILNIFSVASGHLYERFLRIMMLSVLRHTMTPVKFWFLKNYLSPTFKKVIPYMAEEYGFQYELVQYKWPRWLHQQTEKQRIIWGYKILFLDVLFPLALDKIIFVDADQIVRSDLKELRDIDLKGAPYGYTPFCDSRKEMDGYRFWKSGYWASHLGGKKYHISALYVVDLKRFRKIAAGDRLRGQYQALSQDPNSLSNLDQDLPNNMIHQVAIKSLPQEWLWCETWCNDESKEKAKTIDLCNNPKTKEPKLEAAIRIIPEWTQYDSEIQKVINRMRKEQQDMMQSSQTGELQKCNELLHGLSKVFQKS